MKRYVATVYRRKWLYAAVFVMLGAAAVAGAILLSKPYQTTARIWVDRAPVTNVVSQQTYYSQTPAQEQGDMLYQLLQTDSFMTAVLKQTSGATRLTGDPQHDASVVGGIRSEMSYAVLGPNTIMITLKGGDPALSQQIVQGTIDQFRAWLLQSQTEQETTEITYYRQQVNSLRDQVASAQQQLDAFTKANPNVQQGSPAYLTLQRLNTNLDSARNLEMTAEDNLSRAQLVSSLTSSSEVAQFRVLDSPGTTTSTRSRLKYLGLGLGAVFGIVVAFIALVTWQDKSIRSIEEMGEVTDLPVLAVLPHLSRQPATSGATAAPRQAARTSAPATPPSIGPAYPASADR